MFKRTTKELKKMSYDDLRFLRNEEIDLIKKFRLALVRYTFADLDSNGTNTFINSIKKKEKRALKRYKDLTKEINLRDYA
jgi:hypothetical protein